MENKIKVFIVDDHDMFREGIKVLLNNSTKIGIIGEARNGKEFIDCLSQIKPDVVLMDISMPVMDGIEATQKALTINSELNILALSMFGDEEYYFKMVHSGVKGFVLESSGINELENAIFEVSEGKNYFSSELLRQIIVNLKVEKEKEPEKQLLSLRENEVLKHIANGYSNEEIAEKLNISVTTVKTHRANLLAKTNSNNTASLVMYAIKNKLIQVD
jgi:DNA-binding NarL/FixJ family response regulator